MLLEHLFPTGRVVVFLRERCSLLEQAWTIAFAVPEQWLNGAKVTIDGLSTRGMMGKMLTNGIGVKRIA